MVANVTVGGDNLGNIVVGDHNVVITAGAGAIVYAGEHPPVPRPAAQRVDLRPRPFPDLLDRTDELERALTALGTADPEPVELSGAAGIGKTSVLRKIAWDGIVDRIAPHGVVYLDAAGQTADDLLQQVFEALFDCDARYKPTLVQLRRLLADRSALVMFDDFDATREELERTANLAAKLSLVATTRQRLLTAEACAVTLGGLPLGDALELVAREVERPLSPDELVAARVLVAAFDGNPLALQQAAAHCRIEHVSLAAIAETVRSARDAPSALAAEVQRALRPDERAVVAALAAVGGAPLDATSIGGIAGVANPDEALRTLRDRKVVGFDGMRYRVLAAAGVALGLMLAATLPAAAALQYLAASAAQAAPAQLVSNSGAIVAALQSGAASNPGAAIALAHQAGNAVALSGRWDRWHEIVQVHLDAARAAHDASAEAFALHQLGTRSLVLGDLPAAQTALEAALRLRNELGDVAGAAATRHNLGILGPPLPYRFVKVAAGALATVALVGAGWWFGVAAPGPRVMSYTAAERSVRPGHGTALCYAVVHAKHVAIDHGASSNGRPSDCVNVRPRITTAYTLSATGTLGRRVEQTIVVEVTTQVVQHTPAPRPTATPRPTRAPTPTPQATASPHPSATPEPTHAASPKPSAAPLPKPHIIAFHADRTTLRSGERTDLCYQVEGASRVVLAPVGPAFNGRIACVVIAPRSTTTYRLVAQAAGGTDQRSLVVRVQTIPKPGATPTPPVVAIQPTPTPSPVPTQPPTQPPTPTAAPALAIRSAQAVPVLNPNRICYVVLNAISVELLDAQNAIADSSGPRDAPGTIRRCVGIAPTASSIYRVVARDDQGHVRARTVPVLIVSIATQPPVVATQPPDPATTPVIVRFVQVPLERCRAAPVIAGSATTMMAVAGPAICLFYVTRDATELSLSYGDRVVRAPSPPSGFVPVASYGSYTLSARNGPQSTAATVTIPAPAPLR